MNDLCVSLIDKKFLYPIIMNEFDALNHTKLGANGKFLKPETIDKFQTLLTEYLGDKTSIISSERLRSKKNIVLLLQLSDSSRIVAKLFIEPTCENELAVLNKAIDCELRVPRILMNEDDVILLQWIDGDSLVDYVNRSFDEGVAEQLAEWYYDFHHNLQLIKGDPRLRNFIYTKNGIFGLDFEESRPGSWMIDIAGVSASLLDTNPIFDLRKRRMCWVLLESYLSLVGNLRTKALEDDFIDRVVETLITTSNWRNDRTILNLAYQIKQNGIPT